MKEKLKKHLEKQLALWAKRVVSRSKTDVIGITGSIAKTSTKEAVFEVLRVKFGDSVGKSAGNMNNEMGMPLCLLGFSKPPTIWQYPLVYMVAWWRSRYYKCKEIMILEMGVDKPGDIDYLVSIVQPKIAIVTAVGASHLERLKTIANVAAEKAKLVGALPKDGVAILNGNDRYAVGMSELASMKPILFFPEIDTIAQEAARAVGRLYEISEDEIESAILKANVGGRFELVGGKNGSIIMDDSYNANPLSMDVALHKLKKIADEKKSKRKIAVLGDMLELGDYAREAHFELGEKSKKMADVVVGVGREMKKLELDKWFETNVEAAEWLLKEIGEGDIILIKGSHGIHLEKVVAALRSK